MRRALISLTVAIVVGIQSLLGQGLDDELRLQDSFDLLQLQMKMGVLRQLETRGFYIAPGVFERYQEEYVTLASSLDDGARRQRGEISAWLEENNKTAKAQKQAMLKLAEKWGKRVIRAVADEARVYREAQQTVGEWDRSRKQSALEAARYVERLAQDYDNYMNHAQNEEWKHSARQAYRGAISEADDLVSSIQTLNRKRAGVVASLETIDYVCNRLTQLEKLQAFHASPTGFLCAEAEAKALEYLQKEFPTADHATINFGVQKAKLVLNKIQGAAATLAKLDGDKNLRAYPETLKMAKQFAVLSAVYDTTAGIAKDLEATAGLGPLFEVINYYGKAIALIPTVAQKMSVLAARSEQDVLGMRGLTHWRSIRNRHGDLWKTELLKHFGVQVAAGSAASEGDAEDYYLVVKPEVAADGYVRLSSHEYNNLAQALCYERLINARKEASAGFLNTVWAAWAGEESALARRPAKDYLKSLAKQASHNRFTDKQLVALARGGSVSIHGVKWSLDKLARRANTKLNTMAREFTVRRAMAQSGVTEEYSHVFYRRWQAFRDLVKSHALTDDRGDTHRALVSPDRMLSMFAFYLKNPNPTVMKRTLTNQTQGLMAERLGVPRLGVPLIDVGPKDEVEPGQRETAEVTVIVGDLKPGRRVGAELTLTAPSWGTGELASSRMTVDNGGHRTRLAFTVPPNVEFGPHRLFCKAIVRAAAHHEQVEARGWVTVEVGSSRTYRGSMPPELQQLWKKILTQYARSRGARVTQATLKLNPLILKIESGEVRPSPFSMSIGGALSDTEGTDSVSSSFTIEFEAGRLAEDGTARGSWSTRAVLRGREHGEPLREDTNMGGIWRAEPREGSRNEYNFYMSEKESAPVFFVLRPLQTSGRNDGQRP